MFAENAVDSQRILYTASNFARSSLLYLQEVGQLKALKSHTSTRSGLSSYLFFVVLDGSGTLRYEGDTFSLSKGDCVFVDCLTQYSHRTGNDLWCLQWVHFNGEFMAGIYNKYKERGGQPVFHPQRVDIYVSLLSQIYEIANSDDYLRDMRINEQFSSLLTHIMEVSWQPEKQAEMRRGSYRSYSLLDIKKHLDDNWAKQINIDDLANRFFINKYHLMRLFKNQYGKTVLNYVLDLRITHAKKLLRFTNADVESIARECGFESGNYFSRLFKKVENITPSEYRKLWTQ